MTVNQLIPQLDTRQGNTSIFSVSLSLHNVYSDEDYQDVEQLKTFCKNLINRLSLINRLFYLTNLISHTFDESGFLFLKG